MIMNNKSIFTAGAIVFFCLIISALTLIKNSENMIQAQSGNENSSYCNRSAETSDKNKSVDKRYCDFSEYKTLKTGSLKINALPQPGYPPEAKEKNIKGCIPVRVLIDKKGDVSKVCLIDIAEKTKGCPDQIEDEIFENLAKEAAAKAKFDVSKNSPGGKD